MLYKALLTMINICKNESNIFLVINNDKCFFSMLTGYTAIFFEIKEQES